MSNSQEENSRFSERKLLEAEFIAWRNKRDLLFTFVDEKELGEVNLSTDNRHLNQGEFVGGTPQFYYELAAMLLRWLPTEMLTKQIEVYKQDIDTWNEVQKELS